jgi:DNA-binding winged helix-turn-helix (wHTH) protein
MSNQIDEKYWLDKLSQSRFFTSKKDVELLRYLINSTHEGTNLKETIIAIEFFGKDSSFDPGSDSIVRSNIYNLRKKLESYYLDEGVIDKVRFIIPKGGYQVKIDVLETGAQKPETALHHKNSNTLKILLVLSTLVMITFIVLYFINNPGVKQPYGNEISPVWDYYAQSENPLIIVLGDYFMMQKTELNDSSYSFVRNPEINNQTDYLNFLEKNTDQRQFLKKLGQSYFGEEIPKCFLQILQVLQNVNKQVKVLYSSELSLADIRENDLIFIGDYSTLNILSPFFEKTGYRYSSTPHSIFLLDNQYDTIEYYYLDNPNQSIFQNDYAIIASITSYSGKRILFLTSFLPFGKSEALFKLQDVKFISELTDSISNFPPEWNLLMKISGLQSSGFYYEILNFSYSTEAD